MAVSDVQLDTGIGVGKAQVFKPIDTQGLFDAQQKRKQLAELAKTRKAKEDQDRLDRLEAQLKPYGRLAKHNEALDSQKQKVLDLLYSPDVNSKMPEIKQAIFDYGAMGKAFQDERTAAEQTIAKVSKGEWDGDRDYLDSIATDIDPSSPNYNPQLDPKNASYDWKADVANMQQARQNIQEFKRENYTQFVQDTAKDLGDNIVKTMNPDTMTATETKRTSEEAKKGAWDSLVASKNYKLFNGVKQIMRDSPGTTEEEALAKIKPIWDNSFDSTVKVTLDKQEQEKKFNFNKGSGSAENKNWALRYYPTTSSGKEEVDIQKIAPAGYNEVMTVEVFDKNNRKVGIEATPVKFIKQPNGKFNALVAVPKLDELNKPTGESEYFETTPDGYGAVVTKVGIDPYAMIKGVGGNKTYQTASAPVKKEKTVKPVKKSSGEMTNKQTNALIAFKAQFNRNPTPEEKAKIMEKYK